MVIAKCDFCCTDGKENKDMLMRTINRYIHDYHGDISINIHNKNGWIDINMEVNDGHNN